MRNMEKTAEKINGQFNHNTGLDYYDMDFREMSRLIDMVKNGKSFEAISMAFDYGFVLGHRATVAGKMPNII